MARYDTTASPREDWELKTELHAVYWVSLSTRRDTLAALVRLDSMLSLSTTPAGTRANPVRGVGDGPILSYTFVKVGVATLTVDSVPTSAFPRGLNESQIFEAPNLFLQPPAGMCREGATWLDSLAVDGVPIFGAARSGVLWVGRFQVDSVTADGVWVTGVVQVRGLGEGRQIAHLREHRDVRWLLSARCQQPIRYAERRRRVLVVDHPDTGEPHDSVVSHGASTAVFQRAR
jgi:hypothetical protein